MSRPTSQKCAACGEAFLGSDCIGEPPLCPVCHEHREAIWRGKRAESFAQRRLDLVERLLLAEAKVEQMQRDYEVHQRNYIAAVERVTGKKHEPAYMHPTDAACVLEHEYNNVRRQLAELAGAEADYREKHDTKGRHNIETGRAWDRMRRAGDAARELLKEVGHERS